MTFTFISSIHGKTSLRVPYYVISTCYYITPPMHNKSSNVKYNYMILKLAVQECTIVSYCLLFGQLHKT